MTRLKTQFTMDQSAAGIVNGYMSGIAEKVSTRQYIDGAVTFASEQLSKMFEQEMDTAARAAPEKFYHVYNWGNSYGDNSKVGLPQFRLWKLVSMGQGATRQLGFTFLPEHVPTPIEPELIALGVKEGVHIFTWKAPVMEYGMNVTIRPKLPGVTGMSFVKNGQVYFRTGEVNTVPGYKTTTGMFSGFFIAWWTQAAPQTFNNLIRPELEKDLITNKDLAAVARKATRRRRKEMSIDITDYRTGEALAIKHMENNRIDYVRRARRRRMDLYGY
jgi:hypothetical protein